MATSITTAAPQYNVSRTQHQNETWNDYLARLDKENSLDNVENSSSKELPATHKDCSSLHELELPVSVRDQAVKVSHVLKHFSKNLSTESQSKIEGYWEVVSRGQNKLLEGMNQEIDLDDISDQSLLPYLLQQKLPDTYKIFLQNGMPANEVDKQAIDYWQEKTANSLPTPKGQLLGCKAFEQFDPGWLETGMNWLAQAVGILTKADFPEVPGKASYNKPEGVKIALIGDWGTGLREARDVLGFALAMQPDIVIHLGDVYFSGSKSEFAEHFLEFLPEPDREGRPDFFSLNANHEMDGAGIGYFNVLKHPLFERQKQSSHFVLEVNGWTLLGLDSAYNADGIQYTTGRIRDKFQSELLSASQHKAHKLILLSHHNPLSPDGTRTTPLWEDAYHALGNNAPQYWYFGHQHIGMAYSAQSALGKLGVNARCAGHGGIPTARGSMYFNQNKMLETIDSYSNEPDAYRPHHIQNGFMIITVRDSHIEEAYFNQHGKQQVMITPSYQNIHTMVLCPPHCE
ncbi:metallophosphoesterase family protein [Endozoicomonas arenosclerae]|uniref:metallophosphoesterase family protein n=1 Tax=Endozoicomonas arenosclerae TaxID=1633495 RepID=UPI0007842E10|nr:metallophosphoesterase [Endozoicomonas arenosclerae]